jgi:hypothetical protein
VTNEFGLLGQINIEKNAGRARHLKLARMLIRPASEDKMLLIVLSRFSTKVGGARPDRSPAGPGVPVSSVPIAMTRVAWPRIIPPSPQSSRSRLGWDDPPIPAIPADVVGLAHPMDVSTYPEDNPGTAAASASTKDCGLWASFGFEILRAPVGEILALAAGSSRPARV